MHEKSPPSARAGAAYFGLSPIELSHTHAQCQTAPEQHGQRIGYRLGYSLTMLLVVPGGVGARPADRAGGPVWRLTQTSYFGHLVCLKVFNELTARDLSMNYFWPPIGPG